MHILSSYARDIRVGGVASQIEMTLINVDTSQTRK